MYTDTEEEYATFVAQLACIMKQLFHAIDVKELLKLPLIQDPFIMDSFS